MPPDEGDTEKLLRGIDPEQLRPLNLLTTGQVVTMMFTDIVDSTRMRAKVGDESYHPALDQHYRVVRECVEKHNGRELKTIGDSFFVVFDDPAAAVECAAQIQQRLIKSPIPVGDESISVRIGLHTGTPRVYRDKKSGLLDLSGTDVDKAARVEGIARGGQVLISEQTNVMARPAAVQDWRLWELKGLGSQRIFEVLYPGKQAETPAGRMVLEPLRFPTPFIGREREVAELVEAIKTHRLLTLLGMGGIGKTRLADEAARRVSGLFDDGAFFIELCETSNSPEAAVSRLVDGLGVDRAAFRDPQVGLIKTLQNRHTLLVLDNFEGQSRRQRIWWESCS
ncbi:MAG: adenylate/guanylate cyclase domain-containing protein [Candidatus Binataceae bacterium]